MQTVDKIFSVADKLILLSGGQGNLGREYARILAFAGAKIAIFDIKNTHNQIRQLIDDGYPIVSLRVDISIKKELESAMDCVVKHFADTPTVLINNAGVTTNPDAPEHENGLFEMYPEEVWNKMIDSHLRGAFLLSQVFIAHYRSAKKTDGSIVNISSTYGLVAPEQAMYEFRRRNGGVYYKPVSYSVAKAGMLGFTQWLADYCSYEKLGIRVNTLVPGGVYTGQDEEFVREYEKRTMLGRMATNKDYNGAILFLASQASAYMTGGILCLDGGWTAR